MTQAKQSQQKQTKGIEYVTCNLCGADDSQLKFRAPVVKHRKGIYFQDEWDVVCCRQCGLIYVNPRIDDLARSAFYAFNTQGDNEFVQDWFIESSDLQAAVWRRFINVLRSFQPGKKLLDVGCGAGTFLFEANKMGFAGEGQEVSPFFISHCRSQGLTIHGDFLEALALPGQSYDCITAFDVIEHHPDPKKLVLQMRHLLKPNGLVMISTHDIGNIFARLYGVKWRYIRPIGHITYFSRKTLGKLLEECGFVVLKVGGIHTINANPFKEMLSYGFQFFRVIMLRSIILTLYKPLAEKFPFLQKWHVTLGNIQLNHQKLLMRAGSQITMDDDMVIVARLENQHAE